MTLKKYISKLISLQKNNNLEEALKLLNEAFAIYPTNNFLKKYEIFLLNKIDKIDEAYTKANNLLGEFKNDEFFNQTYILILEKRKNREEIKDFIQSIILDLPDFSDKFYYFLKSVIERNFSTNESKKLINKLPIKIKSNSNKKNRNYKIYKEKFEKLPLSDAINEIENLMILPSYKDDYDLNLLLAGFYRKSNRFEDALKIYKNLMTIKESFFLYKMLGYTYYRLKDFENALKYLQEVLFKEPEDNILIQTVFKIYEAKKDYSGFKKLIEEILAKKPNAKKLYGYLKKAEKWEKN